MTTNQQQMVNRLLELALERGAIRYGDFTLSSGRKSSYYFDGRLLSLDPEGAYLLGHALLPLLTDAGVEAVGGPTLGADPIVTAVATASWQQGTPMPAFIVRKEAKGYGMGQMIEGPLPPAGASVAIVDDACTTGGSLFHAIDAAEEAGIQSRFGSGSAGPQRGWQRRHPRNAATNSPASSPPAGTDGYGRRSCIYPPSPGFSPPNSRGCAVITALTPSTSSDATVSRPPISTARVRT